MQAEMLIQCDRPPNNFAFVSYILLIVGINYNNHCVFACFVFEIGTLTPAYILKYHKDSAFL